LGSPLILLYRLLMAAELCQRIAPVVEGDGHFWIELGSPLILLYRLLMAAEVPQRNAPAVEGEG
jgi:hypothetical protein